MNTYLLNYLLTPWSRVVLEKLIGFQLVKKFPPFYGTRRFITVLTSARHPSLSWASPIQSTPPHPTSWRSILILSSHLRLDLPSGLAWWIHDFYFEQSARRLELKWERSLVHIKWHAQTFTFWAKSETMIPGFREICTLFLAAVDLRHVNELL